MAKPSKERQESLKQWAFKAWEIHWKELAPKSNSRAVFVKYVIRDNPCNDDLSKIKLGIEAQARHWRKQSKIEKVIGIPCLSAWYNSGRYDDPFIDESAMDMAQRAEAKICVIDGCNTEVHGSLFRFCGDHIPASYSGGMLEAMKKAGLA